VTEHVKRGATLHKDRDVSYEWDGIEDGNINSVWHCDECGDRLELRQRRGQELYVSIGCPCGAASLDVRIADILGCDVEEWDTKTADRLGRGDEP